MREAAKGYRALAGSLTEVTRQRATAAARALVAQGEATAEQVGSLVEELLAQTRQDREAVTALVAYEVERSLGRLALASDGDVAAMVEQVRGLEERVRPTPRAPSRTAPAGAAGGAAAEVDGGSA